MKKLINQLKTHQIPNLNQEVNILKKLESVHDCILKLIH